MSGKIVVLSTLLGLAFVAGLIEHASSHAATVSVVHLFASTALIFAWFYLDARERNYRPSLSLKVFVVGLTVFALPYYLFRSRGGRGGFKAMGMTVLLFIGAMVLYGLGSWSLR